MSEILEKDWKSALTSIIEDLETSEYHKMLEILRKIPKSRRTNREKMPQIIIEHYGVDKSIFAIRDATEEIPRKDPTVQDLLRPFVDKLRNKLEKEKKGKKRKRAVDPVKGTERRAADQQKRCPTDKGRNTQSWRKTISDLKSSHQLLDTDTIFVKVVQKSGLCTYQTKDKVEKKFFYLVVADETGFIKVMVYGKERYKEIMEERSYLFRKIKIDENGVKVNKLSKVAETSAVEVPEEIEMEARNLINPERSVCSIAEVKASPDRTVVNVEGTVAEIDFVEQIKVVTKQKKTKKQDFQLKDHTGSIRICMWGEDTEQVKGILIGDVIKVTNVRIKRYFETPSLNSTAFTRIHKVQSAGFKNVRIEIIGIIKAKKTTTHLEAEFNDQLHTFVVASRLLAEAFDFKLDADIKKSLLNKMPLSADAEIQGSMINKITAA